MNDAFYVPFEPGIGAERVWRPKTLAARVVPRVPEADAVATGKADAWFREPALAALSRVGTRRPGGPVTRVVLMRDKRYLFAAFECMEPEMGSVRRLVPKGAAKGQVEVIPGVMPRVLDYDENVALYLDYRHDKNTYYVMRVNINGARREKHVVAPMGWPALPACDWKEMGGLKWDSAVAERADRWRAAIRVDLASIGVDPRTQPTVGFNLTRSRNVDCWRNSSWADIVHVELVPGLALGDLYLSDRGVRVCRIDWGGRESGPNRVKVGVRAERDCRVTLTVKADDREGVPGEPYHAETRSKTLSLRAGRKATLAAGFELPFDRPRALVTLEVTDADSGRTLYRAVFPLRNHGDLRVNQPYARTRKAVKNPRPDDPRFHERKLEYVLSKLPKFRRLTTAQGAPSDFTLASIDGKVAFNLMEPGALKRIADWICTRFEEDNDRLIAVALLTNDDWVTVHAHPRTGIQFHLTPLSQLRLGGGHCYSRAAIGAGIVNELPDPATGENHKAWGCLVLGHVVTAVRRGGDRVFIDPSFGHFFYNRANTDLATAKEMEADLSLVSRVVKGEKRLANYAKTDAQVCLEPGTIVWPAGAPPA